MRRFCSNSVLVALQLLLLCLGTVTTIGSAHAAGVGIAVTATPDPVAPGQKLIYIVTATNLSATTHEVIDLTVRVPTHTLVESEGVVQPTSQLCDGGRTYPCRGGQLLRFDFGGVAPGKSVTAQIPVIVDSSVANGTVIDFVAIAANHSGVSVSTSQQVIVSAEAGTAGLTLNDVPNNVTSGGALTYNLVFSNAGARAIQGQLDMLLPTGVSFVSASNGGTLSGNTVHWDIGSLPAGAFGKRQLTVSVSPTLIAGTLISAEASLIDTSTGQRRARATAATNVVATPLIDVAVTATPDPVAPGQKLIYIVTATNLSATTHEVIDLTVRVPTHTLVESEGVVQPTSQLCDGGRTYPCRGGQLLRFDFGGVAPGKSVTAQIPVVIDGLIAGGTLIQAMIVASSGAGLQTKSLHTTPYPFNLVPFNVPPLTNAGAPQFVSPNTNVTLDGRASSDPDAGPSPLTFAWRQTAGPAVILTGANTPQPTFTPTVLGTYTFTLTVSDGAASVASSVQIVVEQPNREPVASNDTFVTPLNTTLNVSAPGILSNDTDPDGNSLTTVVQTSPAQGALTLNANGSFTYVPPTNFSGAVTFTYRANDRQAMKSLSNIATVTINVSSNNVAPIANVGTNRIVRAGSLVTLDGSASNDPDNGPAPLSYAWVQGSGPASVLLAKPNTARPSFTLATPGIYSFTLRVSDGVATSAPSTVQIRVPLRGDVDLDGDVDREDVALILAVRNQAANGPNDLRDLNGDGRMDALDARIDVTLCTRVGCVTR